MSRVIRNYQIRKRGIRNNEDKENESRRVIKANYNLRSKKKYLEKLDYYFVNNDRVNLDLVELSKNINNKMWVSASRTRNYAIGDPLLDWFELYYKKSGSSLKTIYNGYINYNSKQLNPLFAMGNSFEQQVYFKIYERFGIHKVINVGMHKLIMNKRIEDSDFSAYYKTIELMRKRKPIIYQGGVVDFELKLYGRPDLIVRSDYINKLFNVNIIKDNDREKYYIVDIKFKKIKCGKRYDYYALNNGSVSAFKSQLRVYQLCLDKMQSYIYKSYRYKNKSFILGRDETFALINYGESDKSYCELTDNAVDWYRDVSKNGLSYNILKPDRKELYPNMCNAQDGIWSNIKKELAIHLGEITLLWMCGIKERESAHSKGVYSWKDERCSASVLGYDESNVKYNIINNILEVNRGNEKVLPKKLSIKYLDDLEKYIYIDFETIHSTFVSDAKFTGTLITVIGIYYFDEGCNNFKYKSFILEYLDRDSEYNLINNFLNFISGIKYDKLIHWSNAEPVYWKKSIDNFKDININLEWFDLMDIFLTESISIKGCYNYRLKSIVNSLYNHGYIEAHYNNLNVQDGFTAMLKSVKMIEDHDYVDIKKYNYVDVKVLYDICKFIIEMPVEESSSIKYLSSDLIEFYDELESESNNSNRIVFSSSDSLELSGLNKSFDLNNSFDDIPIINSLSNSSSYLSLNSESLSNSESYLSSSLSNSESSSNNSSLLSSSSSSNNSSLLSSSNNSSLLSDSSNNSETLNSESSEEELEELEELEESEMVINIDLLKGGNNIVKKMIENIMSEKKEKSIEDDYRDKLKELKIDSDNEKVIEDRLKQMENILNKRSDEYATNEKWVEWVMRLPYKKSLEINVNLYKVQQYLNKELYGLENIKCELLAFINNKMNGKSLNQFLCLQGKPGVGKTSIVRSISEILNIPFKQISLSSDVSLLRGSKSVWLGSTPGAISRFLCSSGINNGIIFFDELDKVDFYSSKGQDIHNALLSMLDNSQNSSYHDLYMGDIRIDLSNIWFICAVNSLENLSQPLKDRLKIISIPDYTEEEKRNILVSYIIPKVEDNYDFEVVVSEDCIKYLVNNLEIRQMRQVMDNLYSKIFLYLNRKCGAEMLSLPYKIRKAGNKILVEQKDLKKICGILSSSERHYSYYM